MMLIDSSILIRVLRDDTKRVSRRFAGLVRRRAWALTRFTQFELLCGCRDEAEFEDLSEYLGNQDYLEAGPENWIDAAQMYAELSRARVKVRSKLDCCIAQVAIDNDATLYHADRDFELIANSFPLKQVRLLD